MAKQFTFRCPDEVWAVIQERTQGNERRSAAVLVDALRQGLHVPEPMPPDPGQVQALDARVSALEGELAQIKRQLAFGELHQEAPCGPIEESKFISKPNLVRLSEIADNGRDFKQTLSLRPGDHEALLTVMALSNVYHSVVAWLGVVSFLHSTELIPLIFQSEPIEIRLLSAVQKQVEERTLDLPGVPHGTGVSEITDVVIERCQARRDSVEFEGRMTLQFDSLAGQLPATRAFKAHMMKENRAIAIAWTKNLGDFSDN